MSLVQQNIKPLMISSTDPEITKLLQVLNNVLIYTMDKNYQILTDEFNKINRMTYDLMMMGG